MTENSQRVAINQTQEFDQYAATESQSPRSSGNKQPLMWT